MNSIALINWHVLFHNPVEVIVEPSKSSCHTITPKHWTLGEDKNPKRKGSKTKPSIDLFFRRIRSSILPSQDKILFNS
jgi:hypothetical protein